MKSASSTPATWLLVPETCGAPPPLPSLGPAEGGPDPSASTSQHPPPPSSALASWASRRACIWRSASARTRSSTSPQLAKGDSSGPFTPPPSRSPPQLPPSSPPTPSARASRDLVLVLVVLVVSTAASGGIAPVQALQEARHRQVLNRRPPISVFRHAP